MTYYKVHSVEQGWVFQPYETYSRWFNPTGPERYYGMVSEVFAAQADAEEAAQNCGYRPASEEHV